MSIQFVGSTSGEGTTLTAPTHQAGDLFVLFYFTEPSITVPTPPAGWFRGGHRRVGGSDPRIGALFFKTAADDAEPVGTWDSASMALAVYRETHGHCLSLVETGNTTVNPGTSITFEDAPAYDSVGNTGNRACAAASGWVVIAGGVKGTPGAGAAPSGFTTRVHGVGSNEVVIHDTAADVGSTSAASAAMSTSAYTATCTAQMFDTGIEIGGGGGESRISNWQRPPMNIHSGDTINIHHATYNATGAPTDADSVPAVQVIKNGVASIDVVTVSNGGTGIYALSYNPAGEVPTDHYVLRVTSVVGGAARVDEYGVNVVADVSGLSTFDPSTDEVTTDTASRNASKADVSGLSTFDPSIDEVTTDSASRNASKADVSGLSTFDPSIDEVTTDSASRNASKADVSGLSTFDPSTDEVTTDTASRNASKADVSGIVGSEGTGARTVTLTVRNTDGDLIPGATVRMQKGGENYSKTLATGTDSVGRDDGIWTVTTTAVNHSSDVRTVTISGDTPIDITVTAVTIQAPVASGTATGVALVLDETNQPEAGVECSAVLVAGNGSTGKFRTSEEWKATSDGDGLVQWNALEHGATYRFYRGGRYASSDYVEATIAAVQSFEIGELVA